MHNHLLPFPRELTVREKSCAFAPGFRALLSQGARLEDGPARRLDEIKTLAGLPLPIENLGDAAPWNCRLTLGLADKSHAPKPFDLSVPETAQGYALHVREDGIWIGANDAPGLFYGLTTLLQMMEEAFSGGAKKIQCCVVRDWPAIPVRAHFDDVSRKRISTVEDFKQIVRELGRLKINYYSPYLEDVLHLRAFPDIGRMRGKLMPGEVREIVGEARANGVEVLPFFQLIGHCENLLAMPNYEHLGQPVRQRMSTLAPENPEVREYLALCIEETCALFPCEYFGMGFDETQGVGAAAYIRHANWCAAELRKHGKKALIWADMFHKFDAEEARRLDPEIILVNWHYGNWDKVPWQDELETFGHPVWGFGGYQNVCTYIPDFNAAKQHADTWAARIAGRQDALFFSQWGDDGYENNRDLCWNLFAYAGEAGWRNDPARKDSFERRFQQQMFGCGLPALAELVDGFAEKISLPSRDYWRMHRKNAATCVRTARALGDPANFENDLRVCSETLGALEREYAAHEKHMRAHGRQIYNHFITTVKLQKLNAQKMLLAFDLLKCGGSVPLPSEAEQKIAALTSDIRENREAYIADWMLNNRREGLEVSTRVFDEVAASFEELVASHAHMRKGFIPLDLGAFYNACMLDIAGIPLGRASLLGTPFRFAGADKTFVKMDAALKTVSVPIAGGPHVRDIHLIAASPMPRGMEKTPLLRVKLLRGGAVVWEDALNAVEHLCDWWAPAGEHIWAGGGYSYADPSRVFPACVPNLYYGLAVVKNFPRLGMAADEFQIEWLGPAEVCVFAATIQS